MISVLATVLLLGSLPAAHADPPASRWTAPTGLDRQSPLMNCDQARAAGTGGAICAWKLTSDVGTVTSFVLGAGALGAYTFLAPPEREGRLEPGIAWIGGLGLTLASAQVVKTIVLRPRPYTYAATYSAPATNCGDLVGTDRDDCWSFYSGHTTLTAFNLFYAASALDLYASGTARRPLVAALGYTAATLGTALVGTARVESGQHFWSDVIVGGAIGAGIGLASPRLTHLVAQGLGPRTTAEVTPVALQITGMW